MEDEVTGATCETTMLRITVEWGGVYRTLFSDLIARHVGRAYLYLEMEPESWTAWNVVEVEEVPASEADLLRFQREGRTVPMVIAE